MWKFLGKIDEKSENLIFELDKSVIFNSKTVYFHLQSILERLLKFYSFKLNLSKSFIEPRIRETLRSILHNDKIRSNLNFDAFDVEKIEEIAIKANSLKHTNKIVNFEIDEIISFISVLHNTGGIIYKKFYNEIADVFNAEFYRIISKQNIANEKPVNFSRDIANTEKYKSEIVFHSKDEIFTNLNYKNSQIIIDYNQQNLKNKRILNRLVSFVILFSSILFLLSYNFSFYLENPYSEIVNVESWDYCNIINCSISYDLNNSRGQISSNFEFIVSKNSYMVYINSYHYINPGKTDEIIQIDAMIDLVSGSVVFYGKKDMSEAIYRTYLNGKNNEGICYTLDYEVIDIEDENIIGEDIYLLCTKIETVYYQLSGELNEAFWLDVKNSPSLSAIHKYFSNKYRIYKFIERYL